MPSISIVGSFLFDSNKLKQDLINECKQWRLVYGQVLNQKCALEITKILELYDNFTKRLNRPIKDLDDVRDQMAVLSEFRACEIQLEISIKPIEESYILLGRYDLKMNDGNAEKVDLLSYGFSKLRHQTQNVQNHLLEIQPIFRKELIDGVEMFQQNMEQFIHEYDLS